MRPKTNTLEEPVVKVESLAARTKDSTKIGIDALDHAGILVELSGEFDVRDLGALRRVLGIILSAGLPTRVDLSGVTFLDVRCARELAARSRLCDHLTLRDPSWQARASLKVCGREARIAYPLEGSPLREPSRRAQAQEHAGEKRHQASALTV